VFIQFFSLTRKKRQDSYYKRHKISRKYSETGRKTRKRIVMISTTNCETNIKKAEKRKGNESTKNRTRNINLINKKKIKNI